jgi:hypothetical protein
LVNTDDYGSVSSYTFVQIPRDIMCELYTTKNCTLLPDVPVEEQSSCMGKWNEGMVDPKFLNESNTFKGYPINCARCGKMENYRNMMFNGACRLTSVGKYKVQKGNVEGEESEMEESMIELGTNPKNTENCNGGSGNSVKET